MRLRGKLIPSALVLLGVFFPGRPLLAQSPSLEYEVKAAFLYNFARFVTWPDDAFESPEAPLSICIIGADPFGRMMDDLVRDERVEDRALAVRRLSRPAEGSACHVLFVSSSERRRFREVLAAVDTRRVLTVSEFPDFLDAGGHVAFFLESGRVRFTISAATVERAEFQVDSRLMRVARIHEDAPAVPDGER